MRNIEGNGLGFHHIALIMDEEYNSVFRQNRTATYLRSLKINKIMTNNQSSAESLVNLHDEITNHTLQGSKHF